MSYFLGIDLGTSYFKAAIFDQEGSLQGMGRQFVEKYSDKGIICELEVYNFWKILRCCIEDALKESKRLPEDILAISYSSQANSFILLDQNDRPLTPLILWPDSRADEHSESLRILVNKKNFLDRTGLGITPWRQNAIAKIEWIQKYRVQTWNKVSKIMSISDYLIYSLTGEFVSDVSTSSMTGLLNLRESKWWDDALSLFNILPTQLPVPLEIGALVGNLTRKGAEVSGLPSNVRLFTGGLDHHMVAIGSGAIHSGYISESTGTVLACVNCTAEYNPRNGINVARGASQHSYFQMAFDENGATSLEWYRKNYAPHISITDLVKQAGLIAPCADGLIARPNSCTFHGLEGFINRTNNHGDAHYIRAILESTALSLLKLVQTLEGKQSADAILPSGGGANSRLWLEIKANLLNKPFLIPESVELACKGAAMICAVGLSYFDNLEEVTKRQVKLKEKVNPDLAESKVYRIWYNSIKNDLI